MLMEQELVLQVQNLVKKFALPQPLWDFSAKKYFTAVDDISFSLHRGEILGLLGTNGAGKTTTIQMLLSLMKPTSGDITYFGKNFADHRSAILHHVSFASTYVKLPGKLTIAENLNIYGKLYGLSSIQCKERIEKYLKFFGMWNVRDKETALLSAGQITRVMLAKAFISEPMVVLLDEPTASLDPDIAHDVRHFVLEQQRERGVSILFTSHNMDEVAEVCDRVLVLKRGVIIANATPEELARSVSTAHITLVVNEGLELLHTYLSEHQFTYTTEKAHITISVDEQRIAKFLMEIARSGISYSYIAIDRPTLEDYFLSVAQQNNKD